MRMPVNCVALLFGLPLLSTIASGPVFAQARGVAAAELVKRIDIPFTQFTLPNGLRVVVHTDHKAPVVAVHVWYHIGSKDEAVGKTGFAHLFEHLMFNGSEHAPGSVIEQLELIGASDLNGTTNTDRTNFYETVPTGALDRALFIESDRMGYLLQGLTQPKLDIQRGVVQNEKRQGDNRPGGLLQYSLLENLFPVTNPYHHTVIGSMTDLDRASMDDVRQWFRSNYGPNNAVLVLSGDVDLATAREKVTHWFGGLPRGPEVRHPIVKVTPLAAPKTIALKDRVGLTTIIKAWPVPGAVDKDNVPLDLAAAILGGLDSSRLNNALVRTQQLAVGVGANNNDFEKNGYFTLVVAVKPGVSVEAASKALDDVLADFLKNGPTKAELSRATISILTTGIARLEKDSGTAETLAEGLTFANTPAHYRAAYQQLAAATPTEVRDIAWHWLSHPALTITLGPGDRPAYVETKRPGDIAASATPALPPSQVSDDRKVPPPLQPLATLTFPRIERAVLSNGIPLYYAQRTGVPAVQLNMSFDAGDAADSIDKLGAQYLMLSMLTEGTAARSSSQIAAESEALGARITQSVGADRSTVGLYALTPNLGPSLDLLADVMLHPAFAPNEVDRVRGELLAEIAENAKDPNFIGSHALSAALYGADHPYGRPGRKEGTPETVKSLTPGDVNAAYRTWLRPDDAAIFAVGDVDIATLKTMLDARFGHWEVPTTPKPVKNFAMATPAPQQRIILIDRPNSPQSLIFAGHLLNATGKDDLLTARVANEILGGGFASRIYHDLREVKSWAYGTSAAIGRQEHQISFDIIAPVQADKTGPAIAAILTDTADFLTTKGVMPTEYRRVVDSNVRALPGKFETAGAVLNAIERIVIDGRSEDYYTALPARYQALTPGMIDTAARSTFDVSKLSFVVVGDAAKIKPQLETLGLPVTVR